MDAEFSTLQEFLRTGNGPDRLGRAAKRIIDASEDTTEARDFIRHVHRLASVLQIPGVELSDPPVQPQFNIPQGLSRNEQAVLESLRQTEPQLVVQEDIAERAKMSRSTVGRALRSLEEKDLVHQPQGDRAGWKLTDKGLTVAKYLRMPNR